MSFVPIRFGDWVHLFLKSNPGENAKEVSARLRKALEAYQAGALCHCGEPIWVIGSAEAGHACFMCITGEADSSEDYEIAEACDKHSVRSRRGHQGGRAIPEEYSRRPAPSEASAPDQSFKQGITGDDVPF